MNVDFVKDDYRFNARASAIILNEKDTWVVKSISLDGSDSYDYTYSYKKQKLYVMKPDSGSVKKAKNEIIFDSCFNYCETFKLVFDAENKLIDIKNIELD